MFVTVERQKLVADGELERQLAESQKHSKNIDGERPHLTAHRIDKRTLRALLDRQHGYFFSGATVISEQRTLSNLFVIGS
jgi:hypothetical protein